MTVVSYELTNRLAACLWFPPGSYSAQVSLIPEFALRLVENRADLGEWGIWRAESASELSRIGGRLAPSWVPNERWELQRKLERMDGCKGECLEGDDDEEDEERELERRYAREERRESRRERREDADRITRSWDSGWYEDGD
jgi:hypothetical protein